MFPFLAFHFNILMQLKFDKLKIKFCFMVLLTEKYKINYNYVQKDIKVKHDHTFQLEKHFK